MPIDETTLDSGTPRTLDGRRYPDHLRPYELYDAQLLPLASELPAPFTFDDLAAAAQEAGGRLYDVVPRWIASATWQGLVGRDEPTMASPRAYTITQRGLRHLHDLNGHRAA